VEEKNNGEELKEESKTCLAGKAGEKVKTNDSYGAPPDDRKIVRLGRVNQKGMDRTLTLRLTAESKKTSKP